LIKNAFKATLLLILFWSCATQKIPSPHLYLGNLPASLISELSLENRILTEDAWNNLRKGKTKAAQKIISKLGEQNPIYYLGFGYASYLLNNMKDAEQFFKASLRNYPDMALIHAGLAQVFQKTGREDEAFSEFREILKKEPNNIWAKEEYENLKNKKTNQALGEARNSLAQGDTEKGKQALLKALHYSPQSTEANLQLAEIYKKEGKFQNALVHLKTASSNEPENREILENYADTLFQAERYARSLEIYEKLKEAEPENKEILDRIERLNNILGIVELPSQYNSIPYSEAVTREEMAALLSIKFKGIVDEATKTPPIIIDIATSWASKFILQMTSLGILDVYPNHTFQPKKTISRAEMAEILVHCIEYLEKKGFKFIQQIQPEKIKILDVLPENYYYKPIIQIVSYDIMTLSLQKEFQPDSPVSGPETIKLLDIILNLIR
jgi:Tfp pilus assembly protein PilF